MTLYDELNLMSQIVDEIAYETDLLALKAAGGSGRRKEWVGRQALKAADAARDAKGLIRKAAFQLHDGDEAADEIDGALAKIADQAAHMESLVAKMAAA